MMRRRRQSESPVEDSDAETDLTPFRPHSPGKHDVAVTSREGDADLQRESRVRMLLAKRWRKARGNHPNSKLDVLAGFRSTTERLDSE